MALYAISDLHLSHRSNKPMDKFGSNWAGHAQRMADAWDATVQPDDVVLCPGDLSWAMKLEEADQDLAWIAARPGRKVLGRGNHDYWWQSIGRVRAALHTSCFALQNDAVDLGDFVVAGSRLWTVPGGLDWDAGEQKVYEREVQRLKLSLEAARVMAAGRRLIVAVHYPPFTARGEHTEFSRLICSSGATLCVYGHLHGARSHATAVEGMRDGVEFHLVACDRLGFVPKALWP